MVLAVPIAFIPNSLLDSKLSDSLYKTNPHIVDVPAIDEKNTKNTLVELIPC